MAAPNEQQYGKDTYHDPGQEGGSQWGPNGGGGGAQNFNQGPPPPNYQGPYPTEAGQPQQQAKYYAPPVGQPQPQPQVIYVERNSNPQRTSRDDAALGFCAGCATACCCCGCVVM